MKTKRGSNTTKTMIISIVVLDIILMLLFLFFSNLILKDFQKSNSLSTFVLSGFAIVIPGTLLILIIIQFYNLHKNRFTPGNTFKRNIILYFVISITMISIPNSFISINFIKASKDNWLNSNIKDAVNIGFNMALEIENSRRKEVELLSKNKFFRSMVIRSFSDKNIKISDFSTLNKHISTIEYYDTKGNIIKLIGNTKLPIFTIDPLKKSNFYPIQTIKSTEILRYQFDINISGTKYIVIISNTRPLAFTTNGYTLTSTKNALNSSSTENLEMSFGLFIYYALFSIPLLLLAILGSFIFSDEIVRPLTDIEKAIRTVAHGNYSYRILSKKKNEFHILISSFNNMIKDIEKSRNKLKHTEQISTWQDIATRLAHEIRNPLTPIKLSAQRVLLKDNAQDRNRVVDKYMKTIIKEVTRMEKLLNEFRDFARFPQLNLNKSSIKEAIKEGTGIYKTTYPNIEFDLTDIDNMEIIFDKNQIIQVISNLTINGIHAMEDRGIIKFTCDTVQKKDQEFCRISVKDSGHGIPKDIIAKLFKPYFTTKHNGSGLGLAIVNKIIIDHKGKIWIESAENVGTTFYFEFPKEVV